jgi:D-apionolactonase
MVNDLHALKAGVFSVGYQNGFIRHIHYGDIEVIRSIYMALRDQNWFTYEHTIENESIDEHQDHFKIQYDCYCEVKQIRIFRWNVKIKGTADGIITFEIDGEALTDVLKNRAGICVLHPIKYTAGNLCELIQPGGIQIKKTFPQMISPENPFKDLTAFRWQCHNDWYILRYEGDIFETEDQRNWSDASYKTFCTPLSKPFPVQLRQGDKVHQKVIFKSEAQLVSVPVHSNKPIEIATFEKKSQFPQIGLAASTEVETLTNDAIQSLLQLKLNHYRVDAEPSQSGWPEKFKIDCSNAKALNLPLEIALHIADVKEVKLFYSSIQELTPVLAQIILLSAGRPATDQRVIDEAETFRKYFPGVKIGAGTDYNYRELNCNRFDAANLDFVNYGIDPQEHAVDDLTIIENIATQTDMVQSAREIYGKSKGVHISSLTLKKRFNPAATVNKDRTLSAAQRSDPRQKTNFTSAFTLGSIKTLAQAEANSITFYQTVGNQGILSSSGEKYPVYDVLREVLCDRPEVIHTHSSQPLEADALLLQKDSTFKFILVNYTSAIKHVAFRKKLYSLQPNEIRVENV